MKKYLFQGVHILFAKQVENDRQSRQEKTHRAFGNGCNPHEKVEKIDRVRPRSGSFDLVPPVKEKRGLTE